MALALVTGASRGIGREIALALANAGHHVIAVAPRYEGYHGVIARPVSMGPAPKEIKFSIDTAIAASNASEAQLKVGAVGRDISGAGLAVLREAGL